MQIRNFNIAASPTPTPTPTPGMGMGNNSNNVDRSNVEGGFAALLRQQNQSASPIPVPMPLPVQAQLPASVSAPPPPRPPPLPPAASAYSAQTSASESGEDSPVPTSVQQARPPQPGKPTQTADKPNAVKASNSSPLSADDLPVDKPRKDETTQDGDEGVNHDPLPGQQRADLQPPTEAALTAPGGARRHSAKPGASDSADPDDASTTSAARSGVELTARRAATMKADAELRGKAARDPGERSNSLPASEFAAAFADQQLNMSPGAQSASAAASATDNALAAAAAAAVSGAGFNPAPDTAREAALAQEVYLPTPVSAPDFAQSLGAQLSVLARDGVQQAELHLNPADMGPVSIHITMDGTQARIDFGADLAATRHAIEAGMPELASALADAGFTLAGGGVSQHPRGRRDGSQGESGSSPSTRREAAGSTGTAPAPRVIRSAISAGGVDLYA